jgi:hypothetical protein
MKKNARRGKIDWNRMSVLLLWHTLRKQLWARGSEVVKEICYKTDPNGWGKLFF